jgi:hypothetical protein|nr:MAG TPA: Host cell surface-exposed lipoprotein [Caudoviricetes sp.]
MAEEKESNKKPVYKKWWFWLIVVFVTIGVLGQNKDEGKPMHSSKQVTVIDFKDMKYNDIATWCEQNKVNCVEIKEYSDTVAAGSFIKQSVAANESTNEGSTINVVYSKGVSPTVSQQNAIKKAESYLSFTAFSRDGLIKQLKYEKFPESDAIYAVDHITVDWNEQAAKKAKSYLDTTSFSRDGLIKQLKYEKFTQEQAEYGVSKVGL